MEPTKKHDRNDKISFLTQNTIIPEILNTEKKDVDKGVGK
jgi:hypothetical protein